MSDAVDTWPVDGDGADEEGVIDRDFLRCDMFLQPQVIVVCTRHRIDRRQLKRYDSNKLIGLVREQGPYS